MRNSKTQNLVILISFAIVAIVLWQFPKGKLILYPFTLLGTWFHEMGHGIMGMILGGDFKTLEINADGSGLAYITGNLFLGNIGQAIVAAAGPMCPTIAGAVFITSSQNAKSTKVIMLLLSFMIFISAVLWIRSWIGLSVISLIGILILYSSLKASERTNRLALQFLGVQAFISVYLSFDYLFSDSAIVGGITHLSDTAIMEKYLFLPHYVWGGIIVLISLLLIFKSLRNAYS